MDVDFSLQKINKILEKQNSSFRLVEKDEDVCSMYVSEIKNEKVKAMNEKLFEDFKQI